MTEAEWLVCEDPADMLRAFPGPAAKDERKLRLFGIACCRQSWDSFADGRLRRAVELAEEQMAGRFDANKRASAEKAVLDVFEEELDREDEFIGLHYHALLELLATRPYDILSAAGCAGTVAELVEYGDAHTFSGLRDEIQAIQSELLRDIFGNPFRSVVRSVEWRTSTALALAHQMYESRDFSAMPILADALQDAGCDNDDMLTHCRDTSLTHVRGCWCVDWLLGRA